MSEKGRQVHSVLGVDPGNRAGLAWGIEPTHTLIIEAGAKARFPERLQLFAGTLRDLISDVMPELVVYELSRFFRGINAARCGFGYAAVVELVCAEMEVPCLWVDPSELKKWATGDGRAEKAQMRQAAVERFGAREGLTDDEADALCVWAWGMAHAKVTPNATTDRREAPAGAGCTIGARGGCQDGRG